MDKKKPFGIATHEVWEAYQRVKASRGTGASMASQSSSSRRRWNTTSIGAGIGWPPAVLSRRRCVGWTYRKTRRAPGR